MKKDYIKLYLDNVVFKLPEKDREEVRKELSANIYDMLSDNPDEAEIKSVLEKLGSPSKLAEKYRSNPRYLISPGQFENYINVLKIAVPIIAFFSAIMNFIVTLLDVIANNITEVAELLTELIGSFMSALIEDAFSAAGIITIIFVIIEQVSLAIEKDKPKAWTVASLKEVDLDTKRGYIPLGGSIAGIAVTVCLSVFFGALALGFLPETIWVKVNELEVHSIFSDSFLKNCLYFIPVLAAASIFTDVLKIKTRKWTKEVCIATIVKSLINLIAFIFILTLPNMFSSEFLNFIRSLPNGSEGLYNALTNGKTVLVSGIVLTSLICLSSIARAGYRLFRIYAKSN